MRMANTVEIPQPEMQTPKMAPSLRLFNIIMAFQHFAGKSLRATDCADALTDADLDALENSLRKMAERMRQENTDRWPDMHMLASQIEMELRKVY